MNARYYSPELMRFISRDSYDLSNRYAYCNGDPVSKTDPSGHMPWHTLNIALSICSFIPVIGNVAAAIHGAVTKNWVEMGLGIGFFAFETVGCSRYLKYAENREKYFNEFTEEVNKGNSFSKVDINHISRDEFHVLKKVAKEHSLTNIEYLGEGSETKVFKCTKDSKSFVIKRIKSSLFDGTSMVKQVEYWNDISKANQNIMGSAFITTSDTKSGLFPFIEGEICKSSGTYKGISLTTYIMDDWHIGGNSIALTDPNQEIPIDFGRMRKASDPTTLIRFFPN